MAMRDRYADGAIGFVLGVGLALLFVVWDGVSQNEGSKLINQQNGSETASNQKIEDGKVHYWSGWLPMGYVFTEDSLAQWLMTIFSAGGLGVSLLAVIYVKRTFTATVTAANAAEASVAETRRFGEVQERPWLTIEFQLDSDLTRNEREWTTGITATIKNIGKTTALDVTVDAELFFWPILPDFQTAIIRGYANDHIKDDDFPIPGPIHIFPNTIETLQRGVHIPVNVVDDAKSRVSVGLHHFAVAVCVSYRSVLDQKDTKRKLTIVGRDIYKFRDGSDRFIDLFRGVENNVSKDRLILRPPIGRSAIIT